MDWRAFLMGAGLPYSCGSDADLVGLPSLPAVVIATVEEDMPLRQRTSNDDLLSRKYPSP